VIRRINSTGRRKIPRSSITIRLAEAGGNGGRFSADYLLAGLGFPGEARVFIEAYNALSYMRFDFGTIAARREPVDTRLTEITPRPLPKFRLKVVDRRERVGLLLGVADQIVALRPDAELAHRQSLLPVEFCDLGDQVWRLDLGDWPVLELNARIESIGEIARSGEAFLGLVYPEVVRRILHAIVIEQEQTDPGFDESDWTSLWLRFVGALPGVGAPPQHVSSESRAECLEWIEEAVEAFCRARRARSHYEAAIAREGGS
jgi:hypothetical protein